MSVHLPGAPRGRSGRTIILRPHGRLPALWASYLAAGAAGTLLYLTVPPFKGAAPLLNIIGLSAVVAVIAGVRRNKPAYALPWRLFALGLALYWIGDVYTYSFPQLLHIAVPFPSIGDVVYLAVYPALMVGLLLLVRRRNPRGDRNGLIDAGIMTFGLAVVSWVLLIAPYLHDASLGLLPKLVSVAYPVGDIILLAAAIRLTLDSGKHRAAYYLLVGSLVSLLVTDFVYGVLTLDGSYHHQLLLDLGWVSFQLLWGTSALHPSMTEIEEPATDREVKLTLQRQGMLLSACLIPPVCILLKELHRGDLDLIVVIGATVALGGLVFVRMVGLVRQHESALARERLIGSCGTALVTCTSREEMQSTALRAVPRLLSGPGTGVLCLVEDSQLTAVACGQSVDWTPRTLAGYVPPDLWLPAVEGKPRDVALEPDLLAHLSLPTSWEHGLVLALSRRREVAGLLLVASPRPTSTNVRAALHAMLTQLSLALEGARLTEEIHRRQNDARFASLVQRASDIITVVGPDGLIVYQSPSSERVLGYSPEELLGTPFERLVVEDRAGRLTRLLATATADAVPETEVVECTLRRHDSAQRQFEVLCTNLLSDEHVRGIVLNARDVSERNELAHQASHDPMTGLLNRALFMERARQAVARAQRRDCKLAVLFLDIDDFKWVNDHLGHDVGDAALIAVAERLSNIRRTEDLAARFGGDEFVLLLEDLTDADAAREVAQRILDDLRRPLDVSGVEMHVRVSIGISILDPGSLRDLAELIREADAAMYAAKRDGKGGYKLYESDIGASRLADGLHDRAIELAERGSVALSASDAQAG